MTDRLAIGFPLPPQRPPSSASFDMSPGTLNAWFSELPFGHTCKTAEQLLSLLQETNRLVLKMHKRRDFLDMLAGPAGGLLAELQNRLLHTHTPEGKKAQYQTKLVVHFHYELALAYRCLTADKKRAIWYLPRQKQQEAGTLQRSLFHLYQILKSSCAVRRAMGSEVWRMAYSIYSHAEHLTLHREPVIDPGGGTRTLEGLFKEMLLLGFSAPTSLHSNQLRELFEELPELQKHVHMSPTGELASGDNRFHLTLHNHIQPFQLGRGGTAPDTLGLEMQALIKQLVERQKPDWKQQNRPLRSGEMSQATIDILLRSWDAESERTTPRASNELRTEVVLGFAGVCSTIGAGATPLTPQPQGERRSNPIPSRTAWPIDPLSQAQMPDDDYISAELTLSDTRWKPRQTLSKQSPRMTGLLMNESEQGLCLQLPVKSGSRVQVGDLIAIRMSPEMEWMVGAITWTEIRRDGLTLGIERKNINSTATLSLVAFEDSECSARESILLTEYRSGTERMRLLTNLTPHQNPEWVMVQQGKVRLPMRLQQVLSRTNSFVEYSVAQHDGDNGITEKTVAQREPDKKEQADCPWWDIVQKREGDLKCYVLAESHSQKSWWNLMERHLTRHFAYAV